MRLGGAIQKIKYLVYRHPSKRQEKSERNRGEEKHIKQKISRIMKDTNLVIEQVYGQVLSRTNAMGEDPHLDTSLLHFRI